MILRRWLSELTPLPLYLSISAWMSPLFVSNLSTSVERRLTWLKREKFLTRGREGEEEGLGEGNREEHRIE